MIIETSYILAIDTVGHYCGIALSNAQDGSLIKKYVLKESNMHDAMLAEMVRKALIDHALEPYHITAIAVSAGPGSFTGLRIGMSFAKGWCADGKTLLISVPTFDAMIHSLKNKNRNLMHETLCIAKLSHGNQWFVQTFDAKSGVKHNEVSIVSTTELDMSINDATIVIGDYKLEQQDSIYAEFNNSDPEFISLLGFIMLQRGETISPITADSEYHAAFIPTFQTSAS